MERVSAAPVVTGVSAFDMVGRWLLGTGVGRDLIVHTDIASYTDYAAVANPLNLTTVYGRFVNKECFGA